MMSYGRIRYAASSSDRSWIIPLDGLKSSWPEHGDPVQEGGHGRDQAPRPGRRLDLYDRSRDRWAGTITVGWKPDGRRDRITVHGRTKTEVKDKLRAKHQEFAAGVRTPASHTVEQCLNDWLQTLTTQAESTVIGYRIMVRHLAEQIGRASSLN